MAVGAVVRHEELLPLFDRPGIVLARIGHDAQRMLGREPRLNVAGVRDERGRQRGRRGLL